MQVGNWSSTVALNRIYKQIKESRLVENLAELEAFGFTTIPGALSDDQVAYFRQKVVQFTSDAVGRPLHIEKEEDFEETGFRHFMYYQDIRFREAVLNPKTLPLVQYLLGESCILSSFGSHVKGPGETAVPLHSDMSTEIPDPFPSYCQMCNCNYALTNYTEAGGALAMVPGSHRLARHPTKREQLLSGSERNVDAIPIEVPAGTAIIWNGATWHGSFRRQVPGLRVNLSNLFQREYIAQYENYRDIPAGFLQPNDDPRHARLLGAHVGYGWKEEGFAKQANRWKEIHEQGRTWYI